MTNAAATPATGEAMAAQAPANPPSDSLCDLVMKGGITSGVIYPKLVSELSSRYHFKNIGGTSAGAIAAGACAAAEYGRSHGHAGAFDALEKLPKTLGEPTLPSGRSKLFSLFQPTEALRQHFDVLIGTLNAEPSDAVRRVALGLVKMQWILVVAGMLAGSLLLWPFVESTAPGLPLIVTGATSVLAVTLIAFMLAGIAGMAGKAVWPIASMAIGSLVLLALLLHMMLGIGWSPRLAAVAVAMEVVVALVLAFLLLLIAIRFAASLARGLQDNGYGICSGRTSTLSPGGALGLTDWLTQYFNELAGRKPEDGPLTFGDLWGTTEHEAPRHINLEVMTSAVSQNMVYSIPFRKGTSRFFYDPQEWARLFPPEVMQSLENAVHETPNGDGSEPLPPGACVTSAAGAVLRALPRRADLPVVVAVRMSLSFPILLSAVPLYSIDWSRVENVSKKNALVAAAGAGAPQTGNLIATRIWFSDGGIGSNMPLHMFDALLPGHPTFAVNLKTEHPDHRIQEPGQPNNEGGRVYLPADNRGGRVRYWPEPADQFPLGGLIGFLVSIVGTMQNWRDEILFPYPGFRDRIVQISQLETEGGLNLDMPSETIAALANAGGMAAGRLIDRFHPQGAQGGAGWTNHQTVRLGTFLGTMQPGSAALQPSLASGVWTQRLTGITGYGSKEQILAADFLQGLEKLGALGVSSGLSLENGAFKPLAQVGIVPRI